MRRGNSPGQVWSRRRRSDIGHCRVMGRTERPLGLRRDSFGVQHSPRRINLTDLQRFLHVISGRMEGEALTGILLPGRGGPMGSIVAAAAATSSARTFSCPSTSQKSARGVLTGGTHSGSSSSVVSRFRDPCRQLLHHVWMGYTQAPGQALPPGAPPGQTAPESPPVWRAMGNTPEMGRMVPSDSAPQKALVDFGRRTLPLAARILNKIGRS